MGEKAELKAKIQELHEENSKLHEQLYVEQHTKKVLQITLAVVVSMAFFAQALF